MPPDSAVLDDPATGTASNPAGDDAAGATTTGVAGSTTTSQQTDPAAGATTDTAPEEVSTGLISQAEYDKVKDDPVAFRKALLKGFTQATQKASALRTDLGNWAQIRDAYNEDAPAAIRTLAAQLGLEIRDPADTSRGAPATSTAATDAGDDADAQLKAVLARVGLDEVADELAPVLRKIAEREAGKATEPYRNQQEQLLDESAQREANATLEAFGKSHPDWKPGNDVDKAMAKLAGQFEVKRDPKTGKALISDTEYLGHLHFLVTKDAQIAKAAQDAVDRMTKSAAAAETTASTVTGDKVSATPPKGAKFDDAYKAAKSGVRWD